MKDKFTLNNNFDIFDAFTDLVCITDIAYNLHYANPPLLKYYPKQNSIVEHAFPWSEFPPGDAESEKIFFSKTLSGWFKVTRKDISNLNRSVLGYLWVAVPHADPNEVPPLPESKLAGEWYKTLFETSPAGIILLDENGYIIDANQAVSESSQYSREQLLHQHISILALPENHAHISNNITRILNGTKLNQEVSSLRKDGSYFHTLLVESAITLPNGRKGILSISNDISSRKSVEMALKVSEQQFRTIANHTANWELWLDKEGKVKWTNPAAFKFTGFTPEQFQYDPELLYQTVAPAFRTNVRTIYQNALKGSKSKDFIYKYLNSGEERWLSVNWTVIKDSKGTIQGLRSSGQDITEFMIAQQQRQASNKLNQKLIDNAPFGMHFYSVNDKDQLIFSNYNPAADQILNFDHRQLIGLSLEEAFPYNKDSELYERYLKAAKFNQLWHSEQVTYVDNRISGVFDVRAFQTEPGGMVAIFIDITHRKATETALNESRQLFEALTTMAPVGIFRTNSEGATTFVNPEWCALTGMSFEDATQGKYLQALHPDDRAERMKEWEYAVKEGTTIISEYRFVRPNGSVMWVQGQAVPERVDGQIRGFIGTITDITEIIDSKLELMRAKEKAEASNRLKTSFMQNISHEIRTPLNGIFGFAQLLSSGDYSANERQEFMLFLDDSINRLTKTIDNIMEISMLMSGNMQKSEVVFNTNECLQEIYSLFKETARKKNIAFVLNNCIEDNDSLIITDKTLLKRVMEEITDNAIKFTDSGSVTLTCSLPEDELIINICDTGKGIDKLFMPSLFEPFMQQDAFIPKVKNSSGIGLSIVKGVVDLLKGNISVDSNLHSGTSMTINIPVKRLTRRPEKKKESLRVISSENPLILVVEDEEINLLFIKRLLGKYPCRLMVSENGYDAIEQVKQHSDIDLVLMDIKLPGLGGYETVNKMIEIKPDLKVAAVTAYSSNEDREACFDAGCIDFLGKPFHSKDLFELTTRIINWPFLAENK